MNVNLFPAERPQLRQGFSYDKKGNVVDEAGNVYDEEGNKTKEAPSAGLKKMQENYPHASLEELAQLLKINRRTQNIKSAKEIRRREG